MTKIQVGISSCLLGEKVRYDGGHKHSRMCTGELERYFEFTSVCPEMGIGLGVPRKPIRLVGDPANPRAVGSDDLSFDVTDKLKSFAKQTLPELENISGYIFMKGSPSCGLFRVKVYGENGMPAAEPSSGIFSHLVMKNYPQLPVEEAGRLNDPVLKENFISRVFAYSQWQKLKREGITRRKIMEFHSQYKYILMAHSPAVCSKLGRLIATSNNQNTESTAENYFSRFMQALSCKATRKSNTNVLMHLQGYLKKRLHKTDKSSLTEAIEKYRRGITPIIVPITLLKSHFSNHPNAYLDSQAFLNPYPEELSLRNCI
jgi:uncharacterized protein YbgA (DUF1722 family)/uncharacterized protein YbbK (DUF523 family)|tara:strand:- start:1795 stop:2742 length:948 start_codon:yes stop_codon:yes gene_type:complete